MAVAQLGATVLSLKYATEIPRLDTSATGYWVAEDAAITQSDVDINALSLDGTTVGAELAVSRKTVQQSEPAVEDVLKGDLTAVLGDEINSKAIAGDRHRRHTYRHTLDLGDNRHFPRDRWGSPRPGRACCLSFLRWATTKPKGQTWLAYEPQRR